MTTVANNLNGQLFQELNDEMAANLSGGFAYLYRRDNFKGEVLKFDTGTDNLGKAPHYFDEETSSIKISKGQRWAFYENENYIGYLASLEGGTNGRSYTYTDMIARGIPNDSITSLRRTA